MKVIAFIAGLFVAVYGLVFSAFNEREMNYTASTPANKTVRQFLGIDQKDSVDFIRWYLKISDENQFELNCSYGIGKPNTNGFIDEKKVQLKGSVKREGTTLNLHANGRSLAFHVLNDNLLHILNEDKTMMQGNGGWSYTLNSMTQIATTKVNQVVKTIAFNDSIVLIGRTPCKHVARMINKERNANCYKLKWKVILYRDNPSVSFGTFNMGARGQIKGKWKTTDINNKTVYQLALDNGNTLELLPVDKNVVYLLDADGSVLVGDHDFSFSLSRR